MRLHDGPEENMRRSHLLWLPLGALIGFGTSFLFADLLSLPRDLYHLVYFAIVVGFLGVYARRTRLDLRAWLTRRLRWGLLLGALGGLVLMAGVLSRPGSTAPGGARLAWDVLWRGLVYGSVDGLLLIAFPWIVVWRAFDGEEATLGKKTLTALVAWGGVLLVTTAYHLGYGDFRSRKVLQPDIGATIAAVPTLVTANPVASPFAHVVLHATAVLHDPDTDLYLPPHRDQPQQASPVRTGRPSRP